MIARFENERQTLALMEHPNIARILDAGTTDTAVMVAGLLSVSLLAGVIGTTWGLVLAERRAEGERLARQQAQKRLEQIETNNEILSRIFSDLNMRSFRAGQEPLDRGEQAIVWQGFVIE